MHGKNSKDTASQEFADIMQRDFQLPSIQEGEESKVKTSFKARHRSVVAPNQSSQNEVGLNNTPGQMPKRIAVFKPTKNLLPTRTKEYLMIE